jgi:peroxiredoxin
MHRRLHIILFGIGFGLVILAIVFSVTTVLKVSEEPGYELPQNCVEPMEVDFPAPAIELTDIGGSTVSLRDYEGDVVLLNTWVTWCPPCRREMPALETFFREHAQDGFTLLGVNSGENKETVVQFVETFQISFPIWLDPTESTSRVLHSFSLPYSLVLDREGTVRYAWSGSTCLLALENTITPLLNQ